MAQDNPLTNNPYGRRPEDLLSARPASSLPPSERLPTATPPSAAPATPSDAPPAPAPIRKAKDEDEHAGGAIDTVEAVVIALILALTFRAFVIEPFVIPTGSMGPTLLGAHFKVACPKCGLMFDESVSLDKQYNHQRGYIVRSEERTELVDSTILPAEPERACPNCAYRIADEELPDVVARRMDRNERRPYVFPWANNGDRILVLKYLYSVAPPERFDVIVFKEPMHGRDNYIKRLIGLPGEVIEIVDGNIYVGRGPDAQNASRREIARKPKWVQDALWQLVYDHDYYPIDAGRPRRGNQPVWENPWDPQGEWDKISGPVVQHHGAGEGRLHFVVPGKDAVRSPVPNFYTYNISGYDNDARDVATRALSRVPVGDLHLETVWTPHGPKPAISIILGKPSNRFRVTWAEGNFALQRWDNGQRAYVPQSVAGAGALQAQAGRAYKLEMNNVDRRIEFYVDGKLVLQYDVTGRDGRSWTAEDAYFAANAEQDRTPTIDILVQGPCTLSHLKLMRDLYYTDASEGSLQPRTGNRGNPVTLGPDQFFVLGDNSVSSHDGRTWGAAGSRDGEKVNPSLDDLGLRVGIVPRRYLLGKAFYVYWPAGFRALDPSDSLGPFVKRMVSMPLVPNTGDMRTIR